MLRVTSNEPISQMLDEESHSRDQDSYTLRNDSTSNETYLQNTVEIWKVLLNWRTALILLPLLVFLFFPSSNHSKALPFPKILWLYTENEFQAESMYELVYLHHNNHTFTAQGYQVRFVNSLTAYDYISDNSTVSRITYNMQHSQIDEGVHNLLKLALLRQHGGVLINFPDTVFSHSDISWIESLFTPENSIIRAKKYGLLPENAQIFLYKLQNSTLKYFSDLIAARPNATLLNEAFEALLTLISTGKDPYTTQLKILLRNLDTQVDYLDNGLTDAINLVIYKNNKEIKDFNLQSYFGLQTLSHTNYLRLNQIDIAGQQQVMLRQGFTQAMSKLNHNSPVDIIFKVNQPRIKSFLDLFASNINIYGPEPLPQNTLMTHILSSPHNKEIFIDPLPEREIELCLIVMNNLNKIKIEIMWDALKIQNYSKWKLVIPKDQSFSQSPSESTNKDVLDKKIILMEGKSTKVHNIEQAAIKYCDPKGYAVLLNFGDALFPATALQQIANTVKLRDVIGAFIGIEQSEIRYAAETVRFNRRKDGIVTPNITKLHFILNHLRVFSIEAFRMIPQFDLRDMYGTYFQDRLIFLMTLLEMVDQYITQPHIHYLAKKHNQLFNLPNRVYNIPTTTILQILRRQSVYQEQIKVTQARLDCQSLHESITNALRQKIPFTKLIALNPGHEFISVSDRKGTQIIPKIIHQLWLGNQLTPAKQYFFRKTKAMYPDYKVNLWKTQNITRQNFPLTYDLVQNLLEFNKRSPYLKLQTITEILQHELLYHQGGFWKDLGLNLFRRVFDQFRTFKLAITVDKTLRYRYRQSACFFGNVPNLQNLFRITNFRNTNRMRIYKKQGRAIDLGKLIVGEEEYNEQFLLMPYESIYPAQLDEHPLKDLCVKTKKEMGSAAYLVQQNGCYLTADCEKVYPISFGVQHNCFGNSWPIRTALQQKQL